MTTNQLPFEITVDSSAIWLQSLSQLSSVNSAHELNKAVKQLKITTSDADETLKVLINLTPTILYIISDILSSILAETNTTPRKIEKLCIQLLKNLSLGFCEYTNKEEVLTEDKTLAIYFGLQLLGYTQYITTIFHQPPSSTLWGKTAQLYKLAQSTNIVCLEIKHKIKDFKNLINIEAVLKRNLLFSILAPYQYIPSHIKELFFVSNQLAHLLELDSNKSLDNSFYWNSNNEIAPIRQNHIQQESDGILNINTLKILSFIQSAHFSSTLKKNTLNRIIEQISGYKKVMNSSIPVPASNPDIFDLMIGFTEITNFLKKIGNLKQIKQLSSQIIDNTSLENMSLEPLAFEKSHLSPTANLSGTSSNDKLISNSQPVAMLNTKYKQYVIVYARFIDCSIGNIVLLCKSGLNPELGIIRQITITKTSATTNILIEKIFGTPSSFLIYPSKTSAKRIIIIENKQPKPEVLIEPNIFSKGTKIISTLEQSFALDKLIDYSPYFMHFHTC